MQAFFPDFSQNAPAWCENRENHKIRAARSFFSVDFLSERPYNEKKGKAVPDGRIAFWEAFV